MNTFLRRVLAEFGGSVVLGAAVVGSGIAAQTLSPSDVGLQLAENALATGLTLYVLIVVLRPISGAHFNPVISLTDAALGRRRWREVGPYAAAQLAGCGAGVILANVMFARAPVTLSSADRLTPAHFLAEIVATAGLVAVVFVLARQGRERYAPAAVGAYIAAAYFFTSSTSFANPAITVGRILTDSFAGIEPISALGFIAAQLVGACLGFLAVRALVPVASTRTAVETEGIVP